MDVASLRMFCEVARLGSFAAAARQGGVDPSSVSRTIALLEQELGVRLFQRTTRRLSLTEAGDIYLGRVEAIVDELDRARDDAQAVSIEPSGTVRLTTSVAFGQVCVVPLIDAFRARFPDLKLELVMTDANLDLIADRIDLAVRLGPSVDGDLIATKLTDTRYRVCAAPSYLGRAPTLRTPSDLTRHRCVLFTFPEFRSRWLFRDGRGTIGDVAVTGDVLISNALALREAALAGVGPALLADWLVRHALEAGMLVDVLPDYDVAATSFDTAAWLLYPSRAFLPNKVRVTIDFLKEHLARSGP